MSHSYREETVRIPLPAGGHLSGRLAYADKVNRVGVVYVHGFGSIRTGEKANALAQACARRGWTFAAFDFQGHGESSGTMRDLRCSALLEDLEAISGYLAERGMERWCAVGSSMGGWATAWFGLRHPERIAACTLVAPALHFPRGIWERLTEEQRTEWRRSNRLRVRNEWLDVDVGYCLAEERDCYPLAELERGWFRPLLILHGMADTVIPYQHTLAFVQSAVFPDIELRLYRGGDHRLMARADDLAEAACTFFDRVMT